MDKPHQHLFSWDAHMLKAHNTIIMLLYASLPNFPPISLRLKFIRIYLANKKMAKENRPMDKPHQD
jgi:hypothetical protein